MEILLLTFAPIILALAGVCDTLAQREREVEKAWQ